LSEHERLRQQYTALLGRQLGEKCLLKTAESKEGMDHPSAFSKGEAETQLKAEGKLRELISPLRTFLAAKLAAALLTTYLWRPVN